MSKHLGIDLGTANTLVYMKGKGIVLREPSVVAFDQVRRRVVAVGSEAKRMIGKTPGNIIAQRPLQEGVIADFDKTASMLHSFFSEVSAGGVLTRPTVMICIPYGVTEVERRAVEDATYEAGAKSVALVEEPIASAIGSGLKISGARGSMIVDIGGGTTEVAIISLRGIVVSRSIRTAGNKLDEAIVNYMKREHKVLIGDSTAEELKKQIGSVHPSMDRGELEIRGRNLSTGLPSVLTVTSAQVREALREPVGEIIDSIRIALENTPPELSADIFDFGIMLSGGGALLGGMATLITERTGVRVTVAKRPLESVALGLGRVIEGNYPGLAKYRSR
ncbi:MAG: rod shape-determining protein [Clostridia bacterium]|jgi:rod shape-determining protein MreB|nr:rod shape-determining protein [Clostridia bacterium]